MRSRFGLWSSAALFVALWPTASIAFNPLDTNNAYDYVILTHDTLVDQAQRLQTHRALTMRSCIVTTSEVSAAFSGATLAEKIRAFVLYAYQNWKIAPTYLVFLGDANRTNPTYDLLPTMNRYNEFFADMWPGDDYYADETYFVGPIISGERKPVMHLGRIPARTSAQASNAIDKIIAYDGISGVPSWLEKILMTVGDANINSDDSDNDVFRILNDQLRTEEFSDWSSQNLQTIYSSQHPYDHDGTTVLRNAWNGGVGYVNALGNTYADFILVLLARFNLPPATPPTFTENLNGTSYFPVVFAASCLVNYFHVNQESSIGEDLLLKASNRGAVAVIAEGHVEDIFESYRLNRIFVHQMLHEGVRNLGRLLSTAKAELLDQQIGRPELINQFLLLGDPATDIRLNPLPIPSCFRDGIEVEDAPILQQIVIGKSNGITNDNTRVVHADGDVNPLSGNRMLRAKLTDGGSSSDYAEWKVQDLNLPIQNNTILSFWINIPQSPGNAGRIILDGNTTGGRIKDNADIFDQNGVRLDAQSRIPPPSGWQLIYADLSPLKNCTMTDLRLRYETTVPSESGNLTAYIDNIEVAQAAPDNVFEEVLNQSFEDDKDDNGTPDAWTNLTGLTETYNVQRSPTFQTDGNYSMVVYDQDCNNEGAQHIFHSSLDVGEYEIGFYQMTHGATTFRLKAVDAETGNVLLSRVCYSNGHGWFWELSSFPNPTAGYRSGRIKIQILPLDCATPIYVDQMQVHGLTEALTLRGAYSTGSTTMNVQFSVDVSTASAGDPANYTLVSENLVLTAQRDPVMKTVVHLTTDTQIPMEPETIIVSDVTSEGGAVMSPNQTFDFRAGIAPVDGIQYVPDPAVSGDSPLDSCVVTIAGRISAVDGNYYYVQDGSGGPWQGIYSRVAYVSGSLSIGDSVQVSGQVCENNGETELQHHSGVDNVTKLGRALHPVVVSDVTASETPFRGADHVAEPWEGCLVKLANATVKDSIVGIPGPYLDQWLLQQQTSPIFPDTASCALDLINPIVGYQVDACVGDRVDITGILRYTGGWYRIAPRTGRGDDVMMVFDNPYCALVAAPEEQGLLLGLDQNRPNPFGRSTGIRFTIPRATDVTLEVVDVGGRLVRRLAAQPLAAGTHSFTWDGCNDVGHAVGSGTYFCRLRGDGIEFSRKMVVLR